MRKHLIQFLLVAVLLVFTSAAWAQTTVHGQLVDAETGEPLVGAAVMVEGTTQGSVTDIDGYFKQSVASNATLLFKYIGYKDQKKKITQKGASVELGTIKMQPDAVMLSDVTITSSVAVARKTPVAVSTVDPVFIEEKLGSQEFPEILKSTPGIYTTKDGGGYGDAQTRIRGFKSENVAMMITNKWAVSFNSGYDFNAKEITQTAFNITRDLHCFSMTAAISPFGRWKYYNFTIRANASILQDLKWEQRSQTQSNIQWY